MKLGVKNDITAHAGEYKTVPLFDGTCTPTGGSTCSDGFNIKSFGCVQIVGIDNKDRYMAWKVTPTPGPPYEPCMASDPNAVNGCKMCVDERMLQVKLGCDPSTGQSLCTTDCGKVDSGGDPGAGVRALA